MSHYTLHIQTSAAIDTGNSSQQFISPPPPPPQLSTQDIKGKRSSTHPYQDKLSGFLSSTVHLSNQRNPLQISYTSVRQTVTIPPYHPTTTCFRKLPNYYENTTSKDWEKHTNFTLDPDSCTPIRVSQRAVRHIRAPGAGMYIRKVIHQFTIQQELL